MGNGRLSDHFERHALAQITQQGYPAAEAGQRPGVSQYSLCE